MILYLKKEDIELLKKEAQNVFPFEACAILFGEMNSNEAHVRKVYLTPNSLKSKTRFMIEPKEAYRAFTQAESNELDLIGFFHSHQTYTRPSNLDLKSMKLWGNAIWMIYSIKYDNISGYQLFNEELVETLILVEE